MSGQRRDFLKQLIAAGALPGLFAQPGVFGALLDPQTAQQVNPDFDPQAYNFWSGFAAKTGQSAIVGTGQTRGAGIEHSQPVFFASRTGWIQKCRDARSNKADRAGRRHGGSQHLRG